MAWIAALVEWPGWGLLGAAMSAFGAIATVYFSWKARKASESAKDAALQARQTMVGLDAVGQLGLIMKMLTEIRIRLNREEWPLISEKCGDVRVMVAPILNSGLLRLSDVSRKSLVSLQSQLTTLQSTSDGVLHNGNEYDPVKIKRVLDKHSELLAVCIGELKEGSGGREDE